MRHLSFHRLRLAGHAAALVLLASTGGQAGANSIVTLGMPVPEAETVERAPLPPVPPADGGLRLPADAIDRAAAAKPAAPAAEPPYITRHAGNEVNVVVIGDSMADGMYAGLYRVMKDDKRLSIVRKSKANTGIVRNDRYDWNEAARKIAEEDRYDAAVLVFGANDMQSIREGGKSYHFRQPGWETRFRQRVDDILASLKAHGIAAYWVGIPIVRKETMQADYAYINGFFREASERAGVRYIDTWTSFADENGEYQAIGLSLAGKKVQIRADDGVHFTPAGYEKYASIVADVLRRDVDAAVGPSAAVACDDGEACAQAN